MDLENIKAGVLIKRYKRFLADVCLKESGEIITAHCPNSGSMMGLKDEGVEVFVRHIPDAANLKYKLELVRTNEGTLVGINTMLSNKIVMEALQAGKIAELKHFTDFKAEQKFNNSRFDFFLSSNKGDGYLEVKNVTLKREVDCVEFPDAKTQRGSKHLLDLIEVRKAGLEAFNLYLVQREDAKYFKIAKDIDPVYYNNFILAKNSGVKFLCYMCSMQKEKIILNNPLEIKY